MGTVSESECFPVGKCELQWLQAVTDFCRNGQCPKKPIFCYIWNVKNTFQPHRILIALLLAYAIWFGYFMWGFGPGNMTWALCLVFGIQFLLGVLYAFLLGKKKIPAVFAWGTLLFWIAGSAFLPYYNLVYFFDLYTGGKLISETMRFMETRPGIWQIISHSTQVVPNAIVHAAGVVLLGVGLWLGDRKPPHKL